MNLQSLPHLSGTKDFEEHSMSVPIVPHSVSADDLVPESSSRQRLIIFLALNRCSTQSSPSLLKATNHETQGITLTLHTHT
jgi:hypothetical protein